MSNFSHGPKGPDPPGASWEEWMGMALAEARKCLELEEVPVGAVVIAPDGRLLAKAGNRMEKSGDPTAHAEILAMRRAAFNIGNNRLPDCILVCTLEPCLMCSGAISHARLAGVVFGAADPRGGAFISCADYYDLPGARRDLWHLGGIRADECSQVLNDFFMSGERRQKK